MVFIVDNFYTVQFVFSDEELTHYLSCLPTNLLLVSPFVGCAPLAVFCGCHVLGAVFIQAILHLVASSCPVVFCNLQFLELSQDEARIYSTHISKRRQRS
jgi:hypothetical protein